MKINVVAMNESLLDYNLEQYSNFIKSIECVYMYDPCVHTYCCSAQPAYWMMPLYVNIVFVDHCPIEQKEVLQDKLNFELDDIYMYVGDQDIFPQKEFDFESLEDAREALSANHPF